jgi:Cd2+/Zn2+-exporting ATPase
VAGRRVLVGNALMLHDRGIDVPATAAPGTNVFVAVGGDVLGSLALADRPRPQARAALDALKALGVKQIVLLTGDRQAAADPVAQAVGVTSSYSDLAPDEKLEHVRALKRGGAVVAMVGDGVNDAPALALADVGIAMGAIGSDVALETADVALMSDDLLRLPYAVRLAGATVRTIRANVALSLGLKAAFLVAAAMGAASLWTAVLADTGATVIVVANALRLLRQN